MTAHSTGGSILGDVAVQRVGRRYVCSYLWRTEDPQENSDRGSGWQVTGAVLGDVVTQSTVESRISSAHITGIASTRENE